MITALPAKFLRATIFFILFSLFLIFAYPVLAIEDATSTANTKKEEARQKVEDKRGLAQGKVEDLRAKMASKEASLKARLETFKNKAKAQIAERVNTSLKKINEAISSAMKRYLEKMTAILNRLEDRVDSNSPDIKNADLAKEAIASASAAIASASAAVDTQALNDYTIEATSEATIKEDAKAMRRKLHDDLLAVRKLVIAAKQAVAGAIKVAKSGMLEGPKEATESGE